MNDRLLNMVTLIFFASIICNGALIMLSLTPAGGFITGLTNDNVSYSTLNANTTTTTDGFISNTSQSQDAAAYNPFQIITAAGTTILAGVGAIQMLFNGLFLMEFIFIWFASEFVIFAPILLAIAAVLVGIKLLLIGYAGSVLLNAILGRR